MLGCGIPEQSLLLFHSVKSLLKVVHDGVFWKKAGGWEARESWLGTDRAIWCEGWNYAKQYWQDNWLYLCLMASNKLYKRGEGRGEQLLATNTRHLIPITLCVSISKSCLGSHMVPKPASSGDTSGLTAGWPRSLMGVGNKSWGCNPQLLHLLVCHHNHYGEHLGVHSRG